MLPRRRASHTRITIEQVIKIRNQRRAFAAGSHIRGTEIRDHRNAGVRRHHGPFARLPSDRELSSQEPRRRSLVIERLSVAADEIALEAQFLLRGKNGVRIQFAQQKIQPRQVRHTGLRRIHRSQHHLSHPGGIGKLRVPEKLYVGRTLFSDNR